MRLSLAVALFCTLASPLSAATATLIPVVPVAGAAATQATAINDKNAITGVYLDGAGIGHGFTGSLDGAYQTFDHTQANTTSAGIDKAGDVVGTSYDTTPGCGSVAFERGKGGKTKPIKKGTKAISGAVFGMNATGDFVGFYCVGTTLLGFRGAGEKYVEDVAISGTHLLTVPAGINSLGTVDGFSVDIDGVWRGFVLKDGTTTVVTYPGATRTQLSGVNDDGIASGYVQTDGKTHAVLYDIAKAAFTTIEPPGATASVAAGINNSGLLAVYSDVGAFIYCPKKPSKCPASGMAFTPLPAVPALVRRAHAKD